MANTLKKIKKEALQAEDACSLMHTALRKCCDSRITSAAYHLIQIIEVKPQMWDPWILLGKIVARRINDSANKPIEALKIGVEHLDSEWQDIRFKERDAGREPPAGARSTLYALLCVLECMSDDDLVGMASYLEE